jgi:hypothetical protein
MADITFVTPELEPTVCGLVSDFRQLTTVSNAYQLGWMGFAAGIITAILFYVAVTRVAPGVYWYGVNSGWWS